MSESEKKNTTPQLIWGKFKHFLAGSCSGVALVLAGHPFDTVKVRLQTEGFKGRFKGPIHCLITTLKEERIRGLYKGATPPMVATGFINSIMFGLMNICKQNKQYLKGGEPLTVSDIMFCGSAVGVIMSVFVTPMENIKAKLQVQYATPLGEKPKYAGPIDCAKQLIRNNGLIRGLYIGWFPTVLHRGSNWAYFGGYEAAMRFLSPNREKLSPLASIAAGAFAGTCFWFSCYPIDVVKNRIQAAPDIQPPKYRGFFHCVKTIYLEEGIRAFFRGFTPCLIRSLAANSAAFFAFETSYYLLNKIQ